MRSILSLKNLHISPRFSPMILYRDANSVLLLALCAEPHVRNCSNESVKVCLHMYNGDVQQKTADP